MNDNHQPFFEQQIFPTFSILCIQFFFTHLFNPYVCIEISEFQMRRSQSTKGRTSNSSQYRKQLQQNLCPKHEVNIEAQNEKMIKYLQDKEKQIYALSDELHSLQDVNYNIDSNNSHLKNEIRGRHQKVFEKQNILKKRNENIMSKFDDYNKTCIHIKQTTQQNQQLKNEMLSLKASIENALSQLEIITNKDFDDSDVFEALQITRNTVGRLQESVTEKRIRYNEADEKMKFYDRKYDQFQNEEDKLNLQLDDLTKFLFELQERHSKALVQLAIPEPNLTAQLSFIESLEKDVETIKEALNEVDDRKFKIKIKEVRGNYQNFINDLTPRKRKLQNKQKRIMNEKDRLEKRIDKSTKYLLIPPKRTFPYEDEFHDATKIIVDIFDKLYHRRINSDKRDIILNKVQDRNLINQSNQEEELKNKMRIISELTEKYNLIQQYEIDIKMNQGYIEELKNEICNIESETQRISNRKELATQNQFKNNEFERQNFISKRQHLDQIEGILKTKEEKIKKFREETLKYQEEVNHHESQVNNEESRVQEVEKEVQDLKEKLKSIMTKFEDAIISYNASSILEETPKSIQV